LTTKDGRQAPVETPEIFIPVTELRQLVPNDVSVNGCGSDSFDNWCNSTSIQNSIWLCLSYPSQPSYSDGYPPKPYLSDIESFGGYHECYSAASASGLDAYAASVTNGWIIDSFFFWPPTTNDPSWEVNASVNDQPLLIPSGSNPKLIIVFVSWHIGATGGVAAYDAWITVKGPKAFRIISAEGSSSCSGPQRYCAHSV
jgi:hypothetical protein